MLKHLGLVAIITMWLGTYVLLKQHLPDLGKTISKHASKNAKFHLIYGVLEVAVVSLFAIFIFGWFIPNLHLEAGFGIAAAVGLIGATVAAIIPDRSGWQNKVHGISAYTMAMSLIAMNCFLLRSPDIHDPTRIVTYISLAYMILGTIVAITYPPVFKNNALKLQILYFLCFHIPIISAVYF